MKNRQFPCQTIPYLMALKLVIHFDRNRLVRLGTSTSTLCVVSVTHDYFATWCAGLEEKVKEESIKRLTVNCLK